MPHGHGVLWPGLTGHSQRAHTILSVSSKDAGNSSGGPGPALSAEPGAIENLGVSLFVEVLL
jgi:hypothetical protein